ncbi:MAG: hypothetical protein U0892_01850 [Pirellulales bacterium]
MSSTEATGRVANSLLSHNADGVGGNLASNRGGRGSNTSAVVFVDSSQPVIINNDIRDNTAVAISIDADSMNEKSVVDLGRQTGAADRLAAGLGNYGPLVRGNQLANVAQSGSGGGIPVNSMEVRGGELTTESVWDDTDIVHEAAGKSPFRIITTRVVCDWSVMLMNRWS